MNPAAIDPGLFSPSFERCAPRPRYVLWAAVREPEINDEDREALRRKQKADLYHLNKHGCPSPKYLTYRCANKSCRARITYDHAKTNDECLKCILARGEEVNPPLWVMGAMKRRGKF